tara:strand:- start:270 stop:1202 length:933 start_codon:yes stop_codon:yes gene_type:complete
MYDRSTSSCLVEWVEKLEESIQDKIDNKKSLWFQSELTRDDIETMMTPISRSFRSGRKVLIRTYLDINRHTGADKCIVYDESETILGLDALTAERELVPLVQIEGIRFTSRSFEVDLKLVQVMALDKRPDLSEVCLIKVDGVGVSTPSGPPMSEASAMEAPSLAPDSTLIKEELEAGPSGAETSEATSLPLQRDEGNDETVSDPHLAETGAAGEAPSPPGTPPAAGVTMPTVEEITLDMSIPEESMTLKKPDEVYYEIYRAAREKAKRMRQAAVEAYLEARQIKSKYLLNDIDSSDEDEDLVDTEEGSAI